MNCTTRNSSAINGCLRSAVEEILQCASCKAVFLSRAALARVIRCTGQLLLLAACSSLVTCGGSTPSQPLPTDGGPPADGGVPAVGAVSWGFFDYTRDFVGGLSNTHQGRATGIVWKRVEPLPGSGNYDWSELDTRVENAQTAAMNAVLVLKTGNGLLFSEPACFGAVEAADAAGRLPAGRALASCPIRTEMEGAWSQMVTEVVERYDGDGDRDMPGLIGNIRLDIEVENEAVDPQFWDYGETDRTLAADRYLRLLELSYQAKQVADPQTQVILTGLFQPSLLARCDSQPAYSGCTPPILQSVAFTKRILARPEIFDAVDVHFFAYYHFEPELIDDGLRWVVGQMQQRGYQRPIYSLEWTGSNLLHILLLNEDYADEFIDYFPYWADFRGFDAFQAMYEALDQPENVIYRQWFEAEQAKEFGKLFSNMLALGVRRLVHVQYSDYHQGANWNNQFWNWQGIIKYVGGQPIRKPSYYTYNMLSERLFGFTGARRIEQGNDVRLYEFTFPAREPAYVLWTDGPDTVLDLSPVVTRQTVRVTHLVTDLDAANGPIVQPEQTVPATAVTVGDVPVLLEGVE